MPTCAVLNRKHTAGPEEWRSQDCRSSVLLLPIGRGLPDVDIYGIGERGENVIAQVTHSSNRRTIADKIRRLKEYQSDGTTLVFFGPKACRVNDPVVQYIAIENVFDSLFSTGADPVCHQLVSRMLRWG